MRKEEAIERLCALVTEVADKVFPDDNLTHDCFCRQAIKGSYFDNTCVSDKVIEFIENAAQSEMVWQSVNRRTHADH